MILDEFFKPNSTDNLTERVTFDANGNPIYPNLQNLPGVNTSAAAPATATDDDDDATEPPMGSTPVAPAGGPAQLQNPAARAEYQRVRSTADKFSFSNPEFRKEYDRIARSRDTASNRIMSGNRSYSPEPALAARQHQELVKMLYQIDADFVQGANMLLKNYGALKEQGMAKGRLNEFAPSSDSNHDGNGGGDGGVFKLTDEELIKLLNSVRSGLGNKWLADVDQKRFTQLARRDQDSAIFEFDSWLEDLGISNTGFMITDIHVNNGNKIWHGFFRNLDEQVMAKDTTSDLFNMRRDDPRIQQNQDVNALAKEIYAQMVAERGQPMDSRQRNTWMTIAQTKAAAAKLSNPAAQKIQQPTQQSQQGFPAQGSERRVAKDADQFESQDNLQGARSDDEVKFFIDSEPAYYAVMDRFGDHIEFRGDDLVAPLRLWSAIQQTAGDAGGAADIAGLEDDRMGTDDELDEQGVAEGTVIDINNKYRGLARKMVQIYKTVPEVKAAVDDSPEFYRAMVYVTGVITNPEEIDGTPQYDKIVDELESILSSDGEQDMAEGKLKINYDSWLSKVPNTINDKMKKVLRVMQDGKVRSRADMLRAAGIDPNPRSPGGVAGMEGTDYYLYKKGLLDVVDIVKGQKYFKISKNASQGVAEGSDQQWVVTVGTKTGGTSHTMTFSGTKEQAIKKAVARFGTSKNPVVTAKLKQQGVAEGSAADGSVNYTLGHTPDAEYVYSIYRDGKKEGTYHSVAQAREIMGNMKLTSPNREYKIKRGARNKMAGPAGQLPEQGIAEAHNFKGSFPFDVDHMGGTRGINLPSAPTKKFFDDKKQWSQAVDDINSSKYDDNSEYSGTTGRTTVSIDNREWARWSDAQEKGYIEMSSMTEQDISEAHGNYAGDRPVNLGGVSMKKIQIGDTVRYIDQKAQVVDMSRDREHARITIPSSATTKTVLTSDLRQLGRGVSEGNDQQLSVQQLATVSDEALDTAYGYGRSSPGNTFGWQANLKSAAYAKQMIDQGVTDIEAISDAIHQGWNTTAQAFVQNPEQFDDTEKLRAAGKLEAKLQQRAKLMNIDYDQLPDDEQEKDRVVARALLQALTGQQDAATDNKQLDELSPATLARYKTKAGAAATAADSAGDRKTGDRRFSGIVKATKKQFDQDAKQSAQAVHESRLRLMASIIKTQ
jgi:hypothetical protein